MYACLKVYVSELNMPGIGLFLIFCEMVGYIRVGLTLRGWAGTIVHVEFTSEVGCSAGQSGAPCPVVSMS